MRDFDATMSGSFYLTHDNTDLHALFEADREIATYRSVEECVEKALHYLEHAAERETIARAGVLRARNEHTWEQRFGKLFDAINVKMEN
jgi:spore maturation protein CgeB